MELIETQKKCVGRTKELKKDIAKLKEHVLETKTEFEQINAKIDNLTKLVKAVVVSHSSVSYASGRLPTNKSSTGQNKELKDFLATKQPYLM